MRIRVLGVYYSFIRPAVKNLYYFTVDVFLKIFSFLFFWVRPKSINKDNIKRILVIKLERIGDLILSLPALREIRSYFPESKIYMITSPYTKDILETSPYIDELLVYDKNTPLRDKISFVKTLRKYCFDLAIDLTTRNFMFLPVWILAFSKSKVTLGLNNHGRAFLYNIKVKPYPFIEVYGKEVMHILEPLGIESDDYKPQLSVSKESEEFIHRFFKEKNVDEEAIKVVIHPGGYYEALRWEERNYAKISKHLINSHKAIIFFVGTEGEYQLIERIISYINPSLKTFNLAGKLLLSQTMALIKNAGLFIGNSSGPLHIACGFDVPTISFLGPSIPERWWPQGKKNIVFRGRLSERDYSIEYSQNKDYRSLKKITVDEVIKAIDKQLSSRMQ